MAKFNPDKLAEDLAESLLRNKGAGLRRDPKLGHITERDARALTRITGLTVEEFNARLVEKLNHIADLASDRIIEKLEANEFKANELGFIQSVAIDKRAMVDGRNQVNAASVNIQVNNYGSASKDDLLAMLSGPRTSQQPPVEITPPKPAFEPLQASPETVEERAEEPLPLPPQGILVEPTQAEQPRERSL